MEARWRNLSLIVAVVAIIAVLYYVVLPLIPSLFTPAEEAITFEGEYEGMQLLMSSNNFYPASIDSLEIGDAAEVDAFLAAKRDDYLALGTEEGNALAGLAGFYQELAETMKNKAMLNSSMNDFISLAASGSSVEACLDVEVFELNNNELASIAKDEEALAAQAGSFSNRYPDYYAETDLAVVASALNNDAADLRELMAENDFIASEMIEICREAGLA